MIYLSGAPFKRTHPQVGLMTTPDTENKIPPETWWAFDNACFAHPGEFNWDRWSRVLTRRLAESPDRCLFIVAPDVPFDAEGTVRRFDQYRAQLKAIGLPISFVTQNGMGSEDVPWGDIDSLFVGGSTEWKLGLESQALITEAKSKRKWVHMGRVNSLKRWKLAESYGCDSVDGTYLKYGPDVNWKRLISWIDGSPWS